MAGSKTSFRRSTKSQFALCCLLHTLLVFCVDRKCCLLLAIGDEYKDHNGVDYVTTVLTA